MLCEPNDVYTKSSLVSHQCSFLYDGRMLLIQRVIQKQMILSFLRLDLSLFSSMDHYGVHEKMLDKEAALSKRPSFDNFGSGLRYSGFGKCLATVHP